MDKLRRTLDRLYNGYDKNARRFRYGLVVFDSLSIGWFILTMPLFGEPPIITVINSLLGVLIFLDFAARLWISRDRRREFMQVSTLADLVVIASLFLAPLFDESLGFLRILRGLRLIRAYHLLRDLRQESLFFRRHEDTILAVVNLLVFIFVTTSLVFVLMFDEYGGFEGYVDALYFTISTLTTTGFGDIVMTTPGGKLLAVFIMVVGVALFVQLARAIFQPSKVRYTCPQCGLTRHDPDAIHCKHCGEPLKIETEGIDAA